MQHTWPTLSLHTPATTAMDCGMCATSRVASQPAPALPAERTRLAAQAPAYGAAAFNYRAKKPTVARVTTLTHPVRGRPIKGRPIKLSPPAKHKPRPPRGPGQNVFPYGACTWWADQRYYQLHGIFVPWHTQANAWQWTARAYQYGWHVSGKPVPGAIIDLQPWVEGAYGFGHVAVVEKILKNGHVIASNMSWGANPWQVTYVEFAPGPGVTFIYQ